jgi:prepilin-type N-terminal cleavage/methylation domain-containing protein
MSQLFEQGRMRTTISISNNGNKRRGLTLVEMMITMGIFGMVVMAFIYIQMFGLRQDQVVQSKLGASDSSRRGFQMLAEDIRAAKTWQVGNMGSGNKFVAISNGIGQVGSALKIGSSVTSSNYTYYSFDTSAGQLLRTRTGSSKVVTIARYLTNSMNFVAEDYRGNIQTNLSHKGVISVKFEFCQYEYPLTKVGKGYYYDYYKMQFKLTPHVPDGQ